MRNLTKFSEFSALTILIIGAVLVSIIPHVKSVQMGFITSTDKSAYYLREKVTIQGTATFDGLPPQWLVAIEVRNTRDTTVAYRTVPIGNPSETWLLDITDIAMWNMSYYPINTAKVGENVMLSANVTNLSGSPRDLVATISLYDGNMVPLQAYMYQTTIDARSTIMARGTFSIPKWAYEGQATVYANAYDGIPANTGVPWLPEESAQFYISKSQQGWFSYSSTTGTYTVTPTSENAYSTVFTLPPTNCSTTPEPGTYSVYSAIRYSFINKTPNSTTFDVLAQSGVPPTPSFVWSPLQPYPNQTVTFDASSSSANGFNDYITKYEWDWGDGAQDITTSPAITHKFMASRQYTVKLNVTDNEGLWGSLQSPITVKPTNPTAVFTWYPPIGRINRAISFNASDSLPGWSIPQASPAPIAIYTWNFGDGPTWPPVTNPVISHTYSISGNFTVTLTVTDTEGQQNSVSHVVEVQNVITPAWDIDGNGVVEIKDLAIVAKAFGSRPGSPNWDPRADITGPTYLVPDGKVDMRDVALVAIHFGERY